MTNTSFAANYYVENDVMLSRTVIEDGLKKTDRSNPLRCEMSYWDWTFIHNFDMEIVIVIYFMVKVGPSNAFIIPLCMQKKRSHAKREANELKKNRRCAHITNQLRR